jgi:polyhydroxyalkanoate depolymerase
MQPLLYQAYQAIADLSTPFRHAARSTLPLLDHPLGRQSMLMRMWAGACEVVALAGFTHERPPFGISSVKIGRREIPVQEVVVDQTPFCSLLHFRKEANLMQPKVLLVAPVSGHFATLLRATLRTLLADHDVYVTDWHNARDIPLSAGRFDLDDFIQHTVRFLEHLGSGTHVVSVCQPTVPTLAAVALMAANDSPAQPATMTLMAGPIDCRINPTEVNDLATAKPIEWFEKNVISVVPLRYRGALRKVYPGFLQVTAFMSMNPGRHTNSFVDMFANFVRNEKAQAEAVRVFYEEYLAVMDMPAEFYLQTVRTVFQEYHLARGIMKVHGTPVEPARIRRTALFTIEGERDDVCALGQTLAAQDLCSGLRPAMKKHHVQAGVGHYGVFSGKRWENEVYPLVREFIMLHAG